jgi:hypothetical protein
MSPSEKLAALIAEGLTFADAVAVFHAAQVASEPKAQAFISAAQDEADDDFEVDDNAIVSFGDEDGGAYVMGWIWISEIPSREDE